MIFLMILVDVLRLKDSDPEKSRILWIRIRNTALQGTERYRLRGQLLQGARRWRAVERYHQLQAGHVKQ